MDHDFLGLQSLWAYCTLQGVQELQKAQRAARLESGWEKQLEGVVAVSDLTLAYCRGKGLPLELLTGLLCVCVACRRVYGDGGVSGERKQALASLASAKLALQGILSKAKVRTVKTTCTGTLMP